MKLLRSIFLLAVCALLASSALALDLVPTPTPAKDRDLRKKHGPGLFDRLWSKVVPAKADAPDKKGKMTTTSELVERQVGNKRLMLSMTLDPQPLKLTDTRQLKVTLHVANQTKKLEQLEFPTTQRIEVVIRNTSGKLVEQWSEDRSFANEPGMVSVNPGEHLEYSATLSTRDLVAGQAYIVEALFPQYEPLRVQQTVTAEK